MSEKASITDKGAVLLGKTVACDAFDENKPLRIVTHAHADHMVGLQQSLRTCKKVMMTNATKDLVSVMLGPLFLMSGSVETLDYGKPTQFEDERITLHKADHILGAAQVSVEDSDGTRIVFTGDFRLEGTPVLEADILIIEATYGSPSCKRPFNREVHDLLVSTVRKGLHQGPVYIFGFHGKLQEVMQILHAADVNAPFIVPERVLHVSKVCEQHGMRLGRLLLSSEKEVKDLMQRNYPCVAFYHMGSRNTIDKNAYRVYVSGWEFNSPLRQIGKNEYVIALSDHSDFNGLIEYVRRSHPKQVITDNHRVGHAQTLAKEIHKRLGITAKAIPDK